MISKFFQYNIHLPTSMYLFFSVLLFMYLPTYLPLYLLSIYPSSSYMSIYLLLLRITIHHGPAQQMAQECSG